LEQELLLADGDGKATGPEAHVFTEDFGIVRRPLG
jgi:hypothetical protein